MIGSTPDSEWGSWVLGDLADALDRAADLLGGSQETVQVLVAPPVGDEPLPRVNVVARSEVEVARLRRTVEAGEFPADFTSDSCLTVWSAAVACLRLTVEASRDGS
jgi:hypothetical protein